MEITSFVGVLRQVPLAHLAKLLVHILNTIISSGMTVKDVPVPKLVEGLEDEHQIPGAVTRHLIGWFGEVKLDRWNMDREDVVRHVGLGLLTPYKVRFLHDLRPELTLAIACDRCNP
jgi:sister chromatid cohesion protein DCC1